MWSRNQCTATQASGQKGIEATGLQVVLGISRSPCRRNRVLSWLAGVTAVCIRHCFFMAVLIWNFKVDWEAADVETHQEALSPPQADLPPSACAMQDPDAATLAALPCQEMEYFTAVLESPLLRLRARTFVPGQAGISSFFLLSILLSLLISLLIFLSVCPQKL